MNGDEGLKKKKKGGGDWCGTTTRQRAQFNRRLSLHLNVFLHSVNAARLFEGSVPGAHALAYNKEDWQPVKSVARSHKMQDLQLQRKCKSAFFACSLSRAYLFH